MGVPNVKLHAAEMWFVRVTGLSHLDIDEIPHGAILNLHRAFTRLETELDSALEKCADLRRQLRG